MGSNDLSNLVVLECDTCGRGAGVRLAFPLAAAAFSTPSVEYSINLHEDAGWVKDPFNSLQTWWPPTMCEMVQVLSDLSAVKILGDLSNGRETIALDDVRLVQRASASTI